MASTSDIESQHVKDDENLPLIERFQAMLQTIRPPLTSECCIFKVPKGLRILKESAYTPSVISIGPFHHNKDELQFMEKEKVRYLDHYIQHYKVSLDMLLTMVRDSEKSVRRSYGEHIELSSNDFVMMVLLDGLFVIEYFKRQLWLSLRDQNDKMLYRSKLVNSIHRDLILLENQLPFFVLETLYNLIFPIESSKLPFLEISCEFFSYFNQGKTPEQVGQVLHFTDLIRTFHLRSSSGLQQPTDPPENNETDEDISSHSAIELEESSGLQQPTDPPENNETDEDISSHNAIEVEESSGLQQPLQKKRVVEAVRIGLKSIILYITGLQQSTDHPENNKIDLEDISTYTAKELEESGINFRASSSKCLLDIEFKVNDGVLIIPQLEIYDETESKLRNIMALEQYMNISQSYISDYVHLMDRLINTSKDVDLLVRKGIISNYIGDHEEVAVLFNNLNREIMFSPKEYHFSKLKQDLDKYCKKRRHRWRAVLIREYFGSPWQIASVIAAAILLILTMVQTVKAFY